MYIMFACFKYIVGLVLIANCEFVLSTEKFEHNTCVAHYWYVVMVHFMIMQFALKTWKHKVSTTQSKPVCGILLT